MKQHLLNFIVCLILIFSSGNVMGQILIGSSLVLDDCSAVESEPDDAHDGATELPVSNDGTTITESYLKFDISDFPNAMDSVVVSVYGSQQTNQTVVDHFYIDVYAIADNLWQESTLTWNNKPEKGDLLATIDVGSESAWYGVDVTDFAIEQKLAGENQLSVVFTPKEVYADSYVWFSDKSWRDAMVELYELPAEYSSPFFSPTPGQHAPSESGKLEIEIAHWKESTDIYYTLDGSIPSQSSIPYTGSFEIDTSTTIRAIGFVDGETKTQSISAGYFLGIQEPFKATPFEIPGELLLTQFDNGGQDIAYYNPRYHEWDNANAVRGNLQDYREIHSTDEINRFSGGVEGDDVTIIDATPNMGYANAGDGDVQWIEFTLNVKEKWQKVEVTYWKGNTNDAVVGLTILNKDNQENVREFTLVDNYAEFENNGKWAHLENRQTATMSDVVYFPTIGEQVLRLTWYQRAVNLSTLKFSSASANNYQSTGISLDKQTLELEGGQSYKLTGTISTHLNGLTPTDTIAEWKSQYPEIASVTSDGVVKGKTIGTTNVVVTTAFGWTDTCVVTVTSVAGVHTAAMNEKVIIYPNPVNDLLHIQASGFGNMLTVNIIDLQGRNLYSEKHSVSQLTLPIEFLKPGVYLMNIKNENKIQITQRLIVE